MLHCPDRHGREVRDQVIAVLAEPGAAHQALLFRQLSDQTALLHMVAEPAETCTSSWMPAASR